MIELFYPPYAHGGYTEVREKGRPIGFMRQYRAETTGGLIRGEVCFVHKWKAVTHWGPQENYPGNKAPTHWEIEHGA